MKVTKIVVGKGKTVAGGDEKSWAKAYYEVEVLVEDQSELDLAKGFAEGTIDGWLLGEAKPKEPVATQRPVPEIDANELLNHKWKGKKLPGGGYERGKLDWGWDFAQEFSKEVLQVLEKGPLDVDKYRFNLTAQGIVLTKKAKREEK